MINKFGRNSDDNIPIDAHSLGIYFSTLYKETDKSTTIDLSANKVTNSDLDKPISRDKIIIVLSNLKCNKAPGRMVSLEQYNIINVLLKS